MQPEQERTLTVKNLIKQIAEGSHKFLPQDNSPSGLLSFQKVVALLQEAESLGLVENVLPHKDSDSGASSYDSVHVGDVTELGLEFIS